MSTRLFVDHPDGSTTELPHALEIQFTVNGREYVSDGTRHGVRRVVTDPSVIDAEYEIVSDEPLALPKQVEGKA